jgi:group II intron reverse transcriptase/maturase
MTQKINAYNEEWKDLPWKIFEQTLFRLQHRLYKASQEKDIVKCKKLQSLILGSAASRYLAVRQVTVLNLGRKTAGVDGKASLTPQERLKLANELKTFKDWVHQPLRRVYIPKENGESRPLGIPTIQDRAMQCFLKYALEPYYEGIASNGSFGFRPGRRTHDVQKLIFMNLKSDANGFQKRIYELDIEKCFDKIDHNKLLSLIVLPNSAKKVIRSALKVGVLKERIRTLEDTPQGGVISPLLCNLALHGIEDLHNEVRGKETRQRGLRYADDMIFFLKPEEDAEKLRDKINRFLAERGLRVKESKTRLVTSTQGFDFLGWHFVVKAKNKKFVSSPAVKNRRANIQKIKGIMKDTRYSFAERLDKAKVIYRGWRNYHQYCDMSQVNLWSLSRWVYCYCRRKTNMNDYDIQKAVHSIFNGHSYKVNGHVNVRTNKSPFDGDWIYWSKRQDLRYDTLHYKIARRQKYKCGRCKLRFQSLDRIELHHVDGNPENHRYNNLMVLHRFCHLEEPNHGKRKYGKSAN